MPWMMYQNNLWGMGPFGFLSWVWPFVLIDLVLKGLALWRAGNSKQLYWFIALFLINSFGVLPLIYLLFFQEHPIMARSRK